jgi:hypothetical protein
MQSDSIYKTNVEAVPTAMKYLKKIRVVEYDFDNNKGAKYHSFGVIAQELERLGGVYSTVVHTDAEGHKSVDYSKFGVIAIKAIQEQDSIIFQQSRSINELKVEVEALRKVVTELYNIVKK